MCAEMDELCDDTDEEHREPLDKSLAQWGQVSSSANL